MKTNLSFVFAVVLCVCSNFTTCFADDVIKVKTQELPVQLQVGYAVRAIDINADGRLDVAIVDSKRVLWLENQRGKRT